MHKPPLPSSLTFGRRAAVRLCFEQGPDQPLIRGLSDQRLAGALQARAMCSRPGTTVLLVRSIYTSSMLDFMHSCARALHIVVSIRRDAR